jgi:hypothetical protein
VLEAIPGKIAHGPSIHLPGQRVPLQAIGNLDPVIRAAEGSGSSTLPGAGSIAQKDLVYTSLDAGRYESWYFLTAGLLIGMLFPGAGLIFAATWTLLLAALHGIQVWRGEASFKEVYGFQNREFWITMAGTFLAMWGLPHAWAIVQVLAPWILGHLHTLMNYRSNRQRLLSTVKAARILEENAGHLPPSLDPSVLNSMPGIKDSFHEINFFRGQFLKQA